VRLSSRKAQIGLALLVSTAMLAWAGFEVIGPIGAGVSTPVSEVTRGRFVNRINADGVLAAETATAISGPETRRDIYIAWIAEDGTAVKEGDLLFRFDSTELEIELLDSQDELQQTVRRRDQRVQQEETALANLDRDATMASRQLEYAQTFQSKDPEIFSRQEIIQSEIDSILATWRRDNATRTREIREELGAVELALLDLQRQRANLDIEEVEADLGRLEIRAPHDGIFVLTDDDGDLPVIGMEVHGRQTIAEIPQLMSMKANVYVLEADAGGLREGVPAEIIVEAHPEVTFAGRVRRLSALARRKSRFSPVQYFEVEIDLAKTDPERMKPGQRVRATLIIEDLDDVLTIPREAVFDGDDGARIAYRQTVGGFEPVEIVLGPAALGRVVVESGLEEGDVVALQDPTRAPVPSAEEGAPSEPAGLQGPGGSR
jgi:multidrug efflux pump subunit AcrA (membrane-fusion protein)